MSIPAADRMSPQERRAGASLAAIFGLRMLGLFLILPVFAVYAKTLPGGENLALVGFALGAYGLTQAVFQIPYGIASDLWGRKLVIVIGLLIFAFGSFVAAWAPDMNWIIAGRVLQGAGAISAAVTALAADLTRDEHRTKVMAMIGSSIGLVFALSLVGAPVLYGWIGMGGLFVLTGVLALLAIVLLLKVVPTAPPRHGHDKLPLRRVLRDADLFRLNVGIFVLHMMQMAMFVVLPHALVEAFKSTLEEVTAADLLMIVLDGTDPDPFGQLNAVREAIRDLRPNDAPELVVVNKADIADPDVLAAIRRELPQRVEVSALTGQGIEHLLQRLDEDLPDPLVAVDAVIGFERGDLVSRVYEVGTHVGVEHLDSGTHVQARVPADLAAAIESAAR